MEGCGRREGRRKREEARLKGEREGKQMKGGREETREWGRMEGKKDEGTEGRLRVRNRRKKTE